MLTSATSRIAVGKCIIAPSTTKWPNFSEQKSNLRADGLHIGEELGLVNWLEAWHHLALDNHLGVDNEDIELLLADHPLLVQDVIGRLPCTSYAFSLQKPNHSILIDPLGVPARRAVVDLVICS
jgi:hypothetical protein